SRECAKYSRFAGLSRSKSANCPRLRCNASEMIEALNPSTWTGVSIGERSHAAASNTTTQARYRLYSEGVVTLSDMLIQDASVRVGSRSAGGARRTSGAEFRKGRAARDVRLRAARHREMHPPTAPATSTRSGAARRGRYCRPSPSGEAARG